MSQTLSDSRGIKGRDFLSMADLSASELHSILDTAIELKAQTRNKQPHPLLQGLALAMLFEKPSLRTRLSFDIGMYQLGGRAFYLSPAEVGLGKREAVSDVGRVIGSMADAIVARVNHHTDLQALADSTQVPVINALSDREHPCQVVTDLMTIKEVFGKLSGLKLAYIGDGANNMAHSLLLGAALVGMDVTIISPEGYQPLDEFVQQARQLVGIGKRSQVQLASVPFEGVKGADVIYTDVWTSMGQEEEAEVRRAALGNYQINSSLLEHSNSNSIVLHCLPAHRGDEITEEVLEGHRSHVFRQAENRLHAQKALLVHTLG